MGKFTLVITAWKVSLTDGLFTFGRLFQTFLLHIQRLRNIVVPLNSWFTVWLNNSWTCKLRLRLLCNNLGIVLSTRLCWSTFCTLLSFFVSSFSWLSFRLLVWNIYSSWVYYSIWTSINFNLLLFCCSFDSLIYFSS